MVTRASLDVSCRVKNYQWAATMTVKQSVGDLSSDDPFDVIVLGAGYAGLMATLRMARRKLRLRIALVSTRDCFIERVRLQEAIATEVPLRIPSIAAFVRNTPAKFIRGTVLSLDADRRRVRIATDNQQLELAFHQAVYALGSDINAVDILGASDHAYRLEAKDGSRSGKALHLKLSESGNRSLRVIVVGGAETGVEAAGEIKAAWPSMEVTIVTRGRCGNFRGPRVEKVVRTQLTRLGVKLIDGETIAEVRPNEIITGKGRSITCDMCVWSTGLHSSPIARKAGIATDERGRIMVDANLRSLTHQQILAVGDAARPIAPTGAQYRQSAFAALVSGAYAADVILAQKSRRRIRPFSFSTFGQGVAVGRGGVGFFSYPDDMQRWFIVKGRAAHHIRNVFVWLVCYVLKVERRLPGIFFWLGRRRVSWRQANDAVDLAHSVLGLGPAAAE